MRTLLRFLLIVSAVFIIAGSVILYSFFNSGSAQQAVLEEQTFDEEIENMEIRVENARVDILPNNDDTIRVVLIGNSDDFTLGTDMSGGRLQIEVKDRSSFFNFNFNRSYSLQVHVPAIGLAELQVNSDNGAIQAKDFGAVELSIEADNGRIELEAVESNKVNVKTDNGRIELTDMEADITARSSNGRITFTGVSGELQARANNGRIELDTSTLDFPVDFETDNGEIQIRTETEPADARIEAYADNGSIELYGQESHNLSFGRGDILIRLVSDNGRIVVE
ncbi:DUF4097 family beta strand repeat-containing protein [Planococcus sp. CAU13]|uniref:DUF4097 family beta strand repeat-containing protein n=1 Tax=Planococcus sp. CAU13 TaxID=1541197 RepID=UPI00052FFB26|nr:DUF4097 family beta strand repeat-containing protein [Planococcus sp. CAU13]